MSILGFCLTYIRLNASLKIWELKKYVNDLHIMIYNHYYLYITYAFMELYCVEIDQNLI